MAELQASGSGCLHPKPRWPQGSWSLGLPVWERWLAPELICIAAGRWRLLTGFRREFTSSGEFSSSLCRSLPKESLTARRLDSDSPGARANGQSGSHAPSATNSQKPPLFLSSSLHSKVPGLSTPFKGEGYTGVGTGVSGAIL